MKSVGRFGQTRRNKELVRQLRALAPAMPLADFSATLETAAARHLRHLPPTVALWQAMTSRARHAHTDYEALLEEGYERGAARFFVIDAMNETLAAWGCGRRVEAEDPVDNV